MMQRWSRRSAMRALAASFTIPTAGCWHRPSLAPEPSVSRAVDVHCHIFNAADLPVRSFVTQVVLEDKDLLAELGRPLITFIANIMQGNAPSPTRELQHLNGTAPLGAMFAPRVRDDDKVSFVARALETLPGANARESSVPLRVPAHNDVDLFFARVRARTGATPRAAREALPSAEDLRDLAQRLLAAPDELGQLVRWACELTEYRSTMLRDLAGLNDGSRAEIKLFAPSLVDYSVWLREDVASFDEQIAVMAAISRSVAKDGAYFMHGFVPFCPARQVQTGQSLPLVQKAINEHGFIGVKLYPPMGFRPYFNSELTQPTDFPAHLVQAHGAAFGRKLDEKLNELYQWCAQNDVPILAHTSYSQFLDPRWGLYTAPDNWGRLLAYEQNGRRPFERLRLNLAHLGGFWNSTDPADPSRGWAKDALRLMATYPNVYGDVADDDLVLDRHEKELAKDLAVMNELRTSLAAFPAARGKLLYGSDWNMLGRAVRHQEYYGRIKYRFRDLLGDAALGPFMHDNAMAFLGLDDPGSKTVKRLQKFYGGALPAGLVALGSISGNAHGTTA